MIEDVVSVSDKERIREILSQVVWEFSPETTSTNFPMHCHILARRPEYGDQLFNTKSKGTIVVSSYYYFFLSLVDKFCEKHNLKYKKVIRACLNRNTHVPGYVHGDPHVDFSLDHIVLLIYLSSSSISSTLVFDKVQRFDDVNGCYFAPQTFPIKKAVMPDFGKIFAFNGRYYHSSMTPPIGEDRIACVFNLLIDKPWYRYLGFS